MRVEDIMVRDIHYITLNCKYRDLQHVLQSTKMKSLPLVESAGETRAESYAGTRPGRGASWDGGRMAKGMLGANASPCCCRQSP